MKVSEILKNVYHVNFDSQFELASTFVRFQEFYENSEFKGKVFTLDEFKKWYTSNSEEGKKTGKFTYFEEWLGFNIPSSVLEPFYQGRFDPLSESEKAFLDAFGDIRGRDFYIIGTFGEKDINTLQHEIAHGLYFTNPKYHEEVLRIISRLNPLERQEIGKFFAIYGNYHPDVFNDETHAYLLTEMDEVLSGGIDVTSLMFTHSELYRIFRNFCSLDI